MNLALFSPFRETAVTRSLICFYYDVCFLFSFFFFLVFVCLGRDKALFCCYIVLFDWDKGYFDSDIVLFGFTVDFLSCADALFSRAKALFDCAKALFDLDKGCFVYLFLNFILAIALYCAEFASSIVKR